MTLIYLLKNLNWLILVVIKIKLLLKSFKRNRYSERNDTVDWHLVLILCCNTYPRTVL